MKTFRVVSYIVIIIFILSILCWKINGYKGVSQGDSSESKRQLKEKRSLGDLSKIEGKKFLAEHDLRVSANKKIDFFGRVIDQFGVGIPGAKIEAKLLSYEEDFYKATSGGGYQVRRNIHLETNQDGFFSIEGEKGLSLNIRTILKGGYDASSMRQLNDFVYGHLSLNGSFDSFSADKENPVIFSLWKKGMAVPLIKRSIKINVDPDVGGQGVYFNFGRRSVPTTNPEKQWDLRVTGTNFGDRWNVRIEAPLGAGFLKAGDEFLNLAPESGYEEVIDFSSAESTRPWEMVQAGIYYKGQNGEKFASFKMRIEIGGKNNGEAKKFRVVLDGLKINPRGSRNLQYDPKLKIR